MQKDPSTGAWLYGGAHKQFPVAEGDVWQIGQHLLGCGDICKGDGLKMLALSKRTFGELPAMTYVDPPWNLGNINSFRTKAGVAGRETDFGAFLNSLIGTLRPLPGEAYIEMGKQNCKMLCELIKDSGGEVYETWDITYYRKNPCKLIRAKWNGLQGPFDGRFGSMDDEDTPALAIALSSGIAQTVFDPCAGRGLTAVTAHNLGRRFVGLELSPYRLAEAIAKLHRLMDAPAERITSFHELKGDL